MSFPTYAHYKDSGVEWLGEVPAHWDLKPLKHLVDFRSGGTPDKANREFWDGEVPWASAKDLKTDELFDTIDHITESAVSAGAASLVEPGSILVVVRGMILARLFPVVTARVPMAINQDLKALSVKPHIHPDFMAWMLRGSEAETLSRLDEAGHGTKALRMEAWGAMRLPVPDLSEQVRIVDFLKVETTKLDALITEQRTLIDLLKEKRQAVISHAVTKGLDPRVAMKDSGVEWLGEVPAHWEVVRNKVIFIEIDERNADGNGTLMTVSHITGVTPRSEKNVNMILAETLEGYKHAKTGDLVINTMWAWMGALGMSPCDGLFSPSYNVYRPRYQEVLDPDYYDLICRVPRHVIAMKANSSGIWESRLRLYPDVFLSMSICVPPIGEQRAIVTEIKRQTIEFDQLICEAEIGIDLLQERRSALISAAVTGKIDVRQAA